MEKILDGKKIAAEILEDVHRKVELLKDNGTTLGLTVVLVGDQPASATYVRNKERTAHKVGIAGNVIRLDDSITQAELLEVVDRLNRDEEVDGILVQLPLPAHISEQAIVDRIVPEKDVDGFHPLNAGRNFVGLDAVWPCTPAGVMEMLRREGISVSGKHAVVVGRSNIVGKPMAQLLLRDNATVSICHSKTSNLSAITSQADILVVAIGRPHAIGKIHVKPGAVVIDVGMNRLDGKLVGDVHFDEVYDIAGRITPVPGGVGPLTIAMLMMNTLTLGIKRRALGLGALHHE